MDHGSYSPGPDPDLSWNGSDIVPARAPWDDQFLGSTGYIDHLKPHHMTYPIMIGEDLWNRPFLAFRTLDIQNQPAVDVIFQRYQDSSTRWACAHHGLGFTSSTMDVFRNEELHKNLSSLVREGRPRPDGSSDVKNDILDSERRTTTERRNGKKGTAA